MGLASDLGGLVALDIGVHGANAILKKRKGIGMKGWHGESEKHSLARYGIKTAIKAPHLTKNYARFKIKDPSRFQKKSFRTLDVGRKGHTKIIIGKLKGKKKTTTQAILIPKKEFKKKLFARAKEELDTSKEYAKEGYVSQAKDEARHAKFFKKEATKRGY